jgi:hypothetical protein
LVVRRSAPLPEVSVVGEQFGTEVVAETGPAVRQAPLVLPFPAGSTHWPAPVALVAKVSLSRADPPAIATCGRSANTVAKTVARLSGV